MSQKLIISVLRSILWNRKWAISHLERIRDGIFPPWVAKPRRREKKFPHEWLSRNSERVFLHERRSREWRNSVSLWLLSHEWGNFPIPNSLQMRNNILMLKRKLEPREKDFYLLVHIYYDPQSTRFITINLCLLSSKLFNLTLEKSTKLRVLSRGVHIQDVHVLAYQSDIFFSFHHPPKRYFVTNDILYSCIDLPALGTNLGKALFLGWLCLLLNWKSTTFTKIDLENVIRVFI